MRDSTLVGVEMEESVSLDTCPTPDKGMTKTDASPSVTSRAFFTSRLRGQGFKGVCPASADNTTDLSIA
jgi:hypothetical protein